MMTEYANKEALLRAAGRERHENNLNYGGVFGADGDRISDIETEVQLAAKRLVYTSAPYAKMMGLPESVDAWYIKGVGYCPA